MSMPVWALLLARYLFAIGLQRRINAVRKSEADMSRAFDASGLNGESVEDRKDGANKQHKHYTAEKHCDYPATSNGWPLLRHISRKCPKISRR